MENKVTRNKAAVQAWLDVLARGAVDEWDAIVDPDVSVDVVFMPGNTGPLVGRDANRAHIGEFWKVWKSFAFHDVEIHATENSDVLFVTARSEAQTAWDAPYANTYVFRMKLRDGRIAEHREFFNPLRVLETFKDHLPA
ncbi:nuclear transport factor 2 family protein [Sphingobium sp.]|uniref:nuclear transport factor 2 family protein n=1 Tax=Sphingobium sp. TaxID=1912891 RepID=UPI0028BF1E08|nr:nuclear transport factor 2 family protein [Sphingobium sp.]